MHAVGVSEQHTKYSPGGRLASACERCCALVRLAVVSVA